ncbi:MAG: LAGLIDADG family homing endonuclease [Candidatus Woesearchaeota archaeon]
MQNKTVYYRLVEGFSYHSKKWVIPQIARTNLRYWLRAFFDCEGWVLLKKKQNRHIGLDSVNRKGLRAIKSALQEFDIESRIKKVKNRDLLRLVIYGKNNMVKFSKEINFLHPEKKRKLEETINSYVIYVWKFPEEKEKLHSFMKSVIKSRIKNKKVNRIRICSKIRDNLLIMKKHLNDEWGVRSIVSNEQRNGVGTPYYELSINKKEDLDRIKENT